METQTQRTDLWTEKEGKERETNGEYAMDTYTLPYAK